jgi:predicted DNA-binding transcriptional regulator AlpA
MFPSAHEQTPSRLPVEAAATYTGLSASTLNKLRVFGGGPAYLKLGRRVAYSIADLDAWLASKRRHSTSEVEIA